MVENDIFIMDEEDLDPFQKRKKKRLISMKAMLKKLQKTNLRTFIAKVAVENGIDRRTVRKDLAALEDAGYIEISNDQIVWIGN